MWNFLNYVMGLKWWREFYSLEGVDRAVEENMKKRLSKLKKRRGEKKLTQEEEVTQELAV